MECDWRTGWYVLAYAILSQKYCCPEKAYFEYMNVGSGQRPFTTYWVTNEMLEEMLLQRQELGNRKAAELYGIEAKNFWVMLKRYKNHKV